MDEQFLFFPHVDGDSWIRADQVIGIYKHPESTVTEVHLANGEITLTDFRPEMILAKIRNAS